MTTFTWVIHDYIARSSFPGAFMRSPAFASDESNRNLWCLECQTDENGTDVYLRLVHSVLQVSASYSFWLLNTFRKKVYDKSYEMNLFIENETGNRYNLPTSCHDLLINDNLILMCKVNIKYQNKPTIDIPPCSIINDLYMILKNKVLTDIKLKTEKCEFSAHRAVLSVRSQVFAAMFKHNTMEQKSGYINMHNVSSEALEQMLLFIYTGKVENLDVFADELLVVADKFNLNRLKLLCEEFFIRTLDFNNAKERLIFADHYHAEQLRRHAIVFIYRNLAEVFSRKDGIRLLPNHKNLFEEIFNYIE